MTNHEESSAENHATEAGAPSVSTVPSGRGLALALAVLGVFLVISITGLALMNWGYTDPLSATSIAVGILLGRLHRLCAAAILLVAPMAVLRAVLLRKGSGERAVRIVEAAAFVALAFPLLVPDLRWLWNQIAVWARELQLALDPPPEPSIDSAAGLLTAGRYISEWVLFKFWVLHGMMVPVALIGVGAAFIHRRRRVMKERNGPTG